MEIKALTAQDILRSGRVLTDACHGLAYECGWWHDLKTGADMRGKRNVGELLCLVHSEISEAMEGHRKGMMDDKLPHRPMLEVELAGQKDRLTLPGYDITWSGQYDNEFAGTSVSVVIMTATNKGNT